MNRVSRHIPHSLKKGAPRGFTLLEVILAGMLTAVVLLIVATGVEVQMKAFHAGRTRVERAQLARTVLHRIADDLRGLLPPAPDGNGSEVAPTDGASIPEETGTSESGGSDWGIGASRLQGEMDWVRLDVVRSVRPASTTETSSLPSAEATPEVPHEIRTIVYYMALPEEMAASTLSSNSMQDGGLVRRELIQPAASWAVESGMFEYRDPLAAPLAREVAAIEFRYHDGTSWLESWDTAASGALPQAIDIRVFFSPEAPRDGQGPDPRGGLLDNANEQPDIQYRLIVPILVEGAEPSTGTGVAAKSGEEEAEVPDSRDDLDGGGSEP